MCELHLDLVLFRVWARGRPEGATERAEFFYSNELSACLRVRLGADLHDIFAYLASCSASPTARINLVLLLPERATRSDPRLSYYYSLGARFFGRTPGPIDPAVQTTHILYMLIKCSTILLRLGEPSFSSFSLDLKV